MSPSSERDVPPVVVAALDLLGLVVFAAVGQHSHNEHSGLGGLLLIVWPFAAGAAVGWCGYVLLRGRAPASLVAGVWVAFTTVVGGQVLRIVSGRGTELSFVLVSTVALSVLLVGWRAIASYVLRRRS